MPHPLQRLTGRPHKRSGVDLGWPGVVISGLMAGELRFFLIESSIGAARKIFCDHNELLLGGMGKDQGGRVGFLSVEGMSRRGRSAGDKDLTSNG